MTTAIVAIASAILGVLAGGGVQVGVAQWEWRAAGQRAARLLLGDLYYGQEALEGLRDTGEWWQAAGAPPVEDWRRYREALAGGRFGPAETPYTVERVRVGRGRVAHLLVTLRPEVRRAVIDPTGDYFDPWTAKVHVDDSCPLCGAYGDQAAAGAGMRPCKICDELLEWIDHDLDRERRHIAECLAADEIRAAIDARIPEVGW